MFLQLVICYVPQATHLHLCQLSIDHQATEHLITDGNSAIHPLLTAACLQSDMPQVTQHSPQHTAHSPQLTKCNPKHAEHNVELTEHGSAEKTCLVPRSLRKSIVSVLMSLPCAKPLSTAALLRMQASSMS